MVVSLAFFAPAAVFAGAFAVPDRVSGSFCRAAVAVFAGPVVASGRQVSFAETSGFPPAASARPYGALGLASGVAARLAAAVSGRAAGLRSMERSGSMTERRALRKNMLFMVLYV